MLMLCRLVAALLVVLYADAQNSDRTWDNQVLSSADQELFDLCQEKDGQGVAGRVSQLLQEGANPSVQGEYNYTALQWAVVRNHDDVVRVLVQAGADTEAINAWGRNALFLAAWEGRDDAMQTMLDGGANASSCAEHDEWNALHKAAEMNNIKQVKMLLAAGVSPLKRTRYSAANRKDKASPLTPRELATDEAVRSLLAEAEEQAGEPDAAGDDQGVQEPVAAPKSTNLKAHVVYDKDEM